MYYLILVLVIPIIAYRYRSSISSIMSAMGAMADEYNNVYSTDSNTTSSDNKDL